MEPAAGPLLLLCLSIFFSVLSSSSDGNTIPGENVGLNVDNPVITITPSFGGSKDASSCERVQVEGVSQLRLGSYANAYKVSLVPSANIDERYHKRIQICFHTNASLGLCQCENDEWKTVNKGRWSSVMSPYDRRYLDLKFDGDIYGTVNVTVDEEFQKWRLFCLAFGFVVLLAAPIVCSWVPFYYGSSMFIGVLLVILIILFQAMKFLPTGRKSALYLTLGGSVLLPAVSYVSHLFSSRVNSVLVNFGLTEEMHNPVSIFVLVGIVLGGAALGYWIVRKFITSEDGKVDGGIALFVKWAMRIIAFTSVLQSSMDTLLAAGAFVSSYALFYFISSFPWSSSETSYDYQEEYSSGYGNNLWNLSKHGATYPKQKRTEFLSRSASMSSKWNTPRKSVGRSETPVKALTDSRSPKSGGRPSVNLRQSYFSTFHKTPDRKKFTKKEWEEFTQESTQQAVNELTASPAFTEWVIKNADRIKLLREDTSESTAGSESGSTEENVVEREMKIDRFNLFNWR